MRAVLNGWTLDAGTIPRLSNCRLGSTQKLLNQLLMAVEDEIEQRMAKGTSAGIFNGGEKA